MHEGFLVASFLALVALVAMYFVPKRRRVMKQQPEQAPQSEGLSMTGPGLYSDSIKQNYVVKYIDIVVVIWYALFKK